MKSIKQMNSRANSAPAAKEITEETTLSASHGFKKTKQLQFSINREERICTKASELLNDSLRVTIAPNCCDARTKIPATC
ncbi:hypothetical protein PHAVU_009G199600 [Phaseolus vulgaris]|uniref:Uncharacterized protein n=1 Tax=Phaseolus vulgaris TaxID=3885 RepID=V7B0C5_PHAVU|nr:hypothetical protein PHAVU_009G199600g [Phaseolus vulgaris]ESW10323.1 hypothetical protein PHAVU_009G199600g [Phaseolus vulgaris]